MGLPPFQAFLEEHREPVYRFLVASVGREEADDCFQETFLSALRAYPRARPGSNLRAWVMTVAHHKAIDAHRARARRPNPVDEVPEAAVRDGEVRDPEVWRRVAGLPEKQRAAIYLRYAADLPYRDIGRIVGSSEAAARQSVRLGLRRLREEWER